MTTLSFVYSLPATIKDTGSVDAEFETYEYLWTL